MEECFRKTHNRSSSQSLPISEMICQWIFEETDRKIRKKKLWNAKLKEEKSKVARLLSQLSDQFVRLNNESPAKPNCNLFIQERMKPGSYRKLRKISILHNVENIPEKNGKSKWFKRPTIRPQTQKTRTNPIPLSGYSGEVDGPEIDILRQKKQKYQDFEKEFEHRLEEQKIFATNEVYGSITKKITHQRAKAKGGSNVWKDPSCPIICIVCPQIREIKENAYHPSCSSSRLSQKILEPLKKSTGETWREKEDPNSANTVLLKRRKGHLDSKSSRSTMELQLPRNRLSSSPWAL